MVFAGLLLMPPLLEKKYTPVATATAPAAPSPSSARREMRGPDGGGCWAGARRGAGSAPPPIIGGGVAAQGVGGADVRGEAALSAGSVAPRYALRVLFVG